MKYLDTVADEDSLKYQQSSKLEMADPNKPTVADYTDKRIKLLDLQTQCLATRELIQAQKRRTNQCEFSFFAALILAVYLIIRRLPRSEPICEVFIEQPPQTEQINIALAQEQLDLEQEVLV